MWRDVDLSHRVIRVPNANKGNSDPWREVPIREELVSLLESWKRADAESGSEYVVSYKGKPVRSVRTAWNTTLREAGLGRHIRPYDLRHGFATEAIASVADYGTVAALMGHRSPTMILQHYQHIRTRQKLEAVANLPLPDVV